VEERPVPQIAVPGERISPTQPFPLAPPPLVRHSLRPQEAFGLTPWDRGACRERLEALRFEGIYTPPTLEGTLMLPGNAGGVNWGGVAVDEGSQRLVVNVQDLPWTVRLVPRAEAERLAQGDAKGAPEVAPMRGTPYAMQRQLVMSPLGVPCNPPPWGLLVGVDLAQGRVAWQAPLGGLRDVAPVPIPLTVGIPNVGGPLLTAGGLVFIGAAFDRYLRAFDAASGEELWRGRLPAGGQATPMSYRVREGGPQYVVIAATGYGRGPLPVGDAIVAFALR
jgi:quinoprotein glucose dehydrogenase